MVFMNSAVTQEMTQVFLEKTPELKNTGIPESFVHQSHPKVLKESLDPAEFPQDPSKEWNPAGHGDIYASLNISGVLDSLITKGKEYLFISNSDNLGATFDPRILNYIITHKVDFLMEVCKRREMDKKRSSSP